MDNLSLWNQFSDIDPKYTKPISGKDYSGTSPNAHYIIQCLTEMFGPVGKGFGWRVLSEDIERFGETAIHWCRIEFWHTDRENTFEAYGQTKMAYKTSKGYIKVDEDAPKKSLTDAITKAAAQVGVAASIFLGRWDDNQYVQAVNAEYREAETPSFDSAACRDRILKAVSARKTIPDLDSLWRDEKQAMSLITEPHFNEVRKAFSSRKAELTPPDPAQQAPENLEQYE